MPPPDEGAEGFPRPLGPSTRAVHAGHPPGVVGDPVARPIFQTSTFFSDPGGAGEVLYTRYGNNPNQVGLEACVAALEGAAGCVAVGSGMGALACGILACTRAGEHIVAARALYGGTRTLLDRELPRLGITASYVDFHAADWAEALRPETRALLLEIPTNPLLRIENIPAVAEVARAREIPLIVDATFATPINFRPLEHGAALVVHSATKYLGGHSDVTAGVVAGSAERIATVRERARSFGPALDPHAAWLVERGLRTLALRVERHNTNGIAIARWFEAEPEIARVHYPGLVSHPDHALAERLLDGFGGMLGIELRGGAVAAGRFIRALRLAKVAPSLGGVETLVSEPRFTSHAALDAAERARLGIPDGFVRFSLGIEDAEDLIADFARALRAAAGDAV